MSTNWTAHLNNLGLMAALAAGGTLLATGWQQIKSVWGFFRGLMIIEVRTNSHTLPSALLMYLRERCHETRFKGSRFMVLYSMFLGCGRRNTYVAMEPILERPALFWLGRVPLLIMKVSTSKGSVNEFGFNIMFIRGTLDIDALVRSATLSYSSRLNAHGKDVVRFRLERRFGRRMMLPGNAQMTAAQSGGRSDDNNKISPCSARNMDPETLAGNRFISHTMEELMTNLAPVEIEDVAISEDTQAMLDDVIRWSKSRQWFEQHNLAWRMGVLWYGSAGNGKTSLARALGRRLDYPVFSLQLASFDNETLAEEWDAISGFSPCIVLIEDIDTVFNGRENVAQQKQSMLSDALTFDGFLNCVDGVQAYNGILLIITTNYIDKIDEALGQPVTGHSETSTRPGRIDRVTLFSSPNEAGRALIARRILKGCLYDFPELLRTGCNDSGAQFEQRCKNLALTEFWKTQPAPPTP